MVLEKVVHIIPYSPSNELKNFRRKLEPSIHDIDETLKFVDKNFDQFMKITQENIQTCKKISQQINQLDRVIYNNKIIQKFFSSINYTGEKESMKKFSKAFVGYTSSIDIRGDEKFSEYVSKNTKEFGNLTKDDCNFVDEIIDFACHILKKGNLFIQYYLDDGFNYKGYEQVIEEIKFADNPLINKVEERIKDYKNNTELESGCLYNQMLGIFTLSENPHTQLNTWHEDEICITPKEQEDLIFLGCGLEETMKFYKGGILIINSELIESITKQLDYIKGVSYNVLSR